ncbi:hypothetical protein [Thalassotalea crassostreae]|uniref:hypothetical protein n=1 Tax=Thalassotalea crassostreae TaxID=1763536 RepID=UPI00083814CA|nr:hypothetical protein [Thalassotalea crassostreae]
MAMTHIKKHFTLLCFSIISIFLIGCQTYSGPKTVWLTQKTFDQKYPKANITPPFRNIRLEKLSYIIKVDSDTWFGKGSGGCQGRKIEDSHQTYSITHHSKNTYKVKRRKVGCRSNPSTANLYGRLKGSELALYGGGFYGNTVLKFSNDFSYAKEYRVYYYSDNTVEETISSKHHGTSEDILETYLVPYISPKEARRLEDAAKNSRGGSSIFTQLAQGIARNSNQYSSSGLDGLSSSSVPKSSTSKGYKSYSHTFSCGSYGSPKTIKVPYKTNRQKQLRIKLAEAGSCNRIEEMNAAIALCQREFGHPYCE